MLVLTSYVSPFSIDDKKPCLNVFSGNSFRAVSILVRSESTPTLPEIRMSNTLVHSPHRGFFYRYLCALSTSSRMWLVSVLAGRNGKLDGFHADTLTKDVTKVYATNMVFHIMLRKHILISLYHLLTLVKVNANVNANDKIILWYNIV